MNEHPSKEMDVWSIVMVMACSISLASLFLAKLYNKICCREANENNNRSGTMRSRKNNKLANRKALLREAATNSVRKISAPPRLSSQPQRARKISLPEIQQFYRNAEFEIPVISTYTESVQSSRAGSLDTFGEDAYFAREYPQLNEEEITTLLSSEHKQKDNEAFEKPDEKNENDVQQPSMSKKRKLFSRSRVTDNSLKRNEEVTGKAWLTLSYEDQAMQILNINLKKVEIFNLGVENPCGLCAQLFLSPDREKTLRLFSEIPFSEETFHLKMPFTFECEPDLNNFETRSVRVLLSFVAANGREIPYGECRMPLISKQIFLRIPTPYCVKILPSTSQENEIGDALVSLSYSEERETFTVITKTLNFTNSRYLREFIDLHVKCQVNLRDGAKVPLQRGPRRSIIPPPTSFSNTSLNLDKYPMTYALSKENIREIGIRINVQGRYRLLGKHAVIGKIRLGVASRDAGGVDHVVAMETSTRYWSMWHVIYKT